ncbi:unnamed protein product [Mesocestoides corti]|uniref:Large ribosomal subunit protein mL44 n=1 Tax=Mesocestoides corti TaxID=53468 RepID=A0A3P6HMF5_MESCO|nr:unnamed protein product [Mesocestoides corti]
MQGPEKFRPRSAWAPWNYDSELLAFRSRLGVTVDVETLRLCLTDKSYAAFVVDVGDATGPIDNRELAETGRRSSEAYICGFLRKFYPRLPEEWIACVKDRLLSDSDLAHVGAHLGMTDILLYTLEEAQPAGESRLLPQVTGPPSLNSIATSFLAVVGALANDQQAAHLFIRDFILTRLLHLEFCADFDFPLQEDPFSLLEGVLRSQKRGPPEARLQRQSSMNTLLACYQVGIYSDCQLVGEAPGETIEIAEKEATLQALRNLFGIHDSRPPLPLSGAYIPVDGLPPNPSLSDYISASL